MKHIKTECEEAAYTAGRLDAQLLINLAFAGLSERSPILTDDECSTIPDYIERVGLEHDRGAVLPDNCVVVFRGGNITCYQPFTPAD
ncbi:MAG: hypothetical protein MRY81_20685 [Donghicola eburneus]|nr:hypothetical protein [Donghicola eburneus]MCI5042084.1 hypothetical protein [Donghicola eburneus]